ncbi:glucoamylase family protein [Oscillospiraceae bacterium WX1]
MSSTENDNAINTEDLKNGAAKAAAEMTPHGRVSTKRTAAKALADLSAIKAVMQRAAAYAETHVSIPQALEWLLDNWYIAEREGKCAIHDLKASPRLRAAFHKKQTLVIAHAAEALVRAGAGRVSGDGLGVFLDVFQETVCLSEDELAAFVPSVRLALITSLADVCRQLRAVMAENVCGDGLAAYLGHLFTSLRFLSGFDASKTLERVNRVEIALRKDPAGIYPTMDEQTRFTYRRTVAVLARETGQSEFNVAARVLALSAEINAHVGVFLFIKPLGKEKKEQKGSLYIGLLLLTSFFTALLVSFLLDEPVIALLLLFPVFEVIKNVMDYFVLRFIPPQRVFRLELEDGIPDDAKTVCVISLLLSDVKSGVRAAALLEEYRLANRDAGKNLLFALLADLPDAPSETTADDCAALQAATDAVNTLNETYGGGFFLLTRKRRFNTADRQFTAWERKRGAILELCRFLNGRPSSLYCPAGNGGAAKGARYVLALDSDTRLSAGSALELVGAMLHPLNTPTIDEIRGIVTHGCGLIQPRISVDLAAANQTDYTRIFAGQGGIDPYGGITSDIYQNLFGTGSFAGKGIIDVAAYLACLDNRFPENTVLSHDLLEGAYLRCVYAGDIELTDGFPGKVTTFYDRMHRWTRGDWQSLPWLLGKVRMADGTRVKNSLSQLDRWKIADNLRRSLTPVFSFAAVVIGMLFDNKDFLWASLIAVLAVVSHLIIASAAGIFQKRSGRVRYHTTIISGLGGQLLQTLIRLVLLPFEAWVCLHAVMTALFRMLISHRHLLRWVTAADTEKKSKNTVYTVILRLWPAVLVSILLILLTPFPAAAAVGVIWALSPILVIALGRDTRKKDVLPVEDKLFLARCAGDIWRFFDDLLTAEDHFLPPDNYQEQPAVGTAHRTSPTNIGLALLSALAAVDLGVCQPEKALTVIKNIFLTIDKLPKWNGHLYNWYDTQTLSVLQPAYVSTVDSGNFAGCLIALREGLLELNEPVLAETAARLEKAMRFDVLFDEKRQLFRIGRDISTGEMTAGWYDLLASEARQTSYIAIARGDISRKHWRRLGRSLVAKDGYRGMASWTGTMFEYFMPELLLPCYENALIDESLRFCLYVQKKRAKKMPWGMSESAFYAFDQSLSYRYKAHGVQRLALKRGMGRESVIAPYATFLTLPVAQKSAVKNLRRLSKLGAEGRYGFYEALDFTPSRMRAKPFEIVKTYMAHHLGMSLIALDNALKNGVMQKRFMRNRSMAAFAELLQEKVPVGGIILRQPPRDVPEKPARITSPHWRFTSDSIDIIKPRCTPIGNGAYTVLCGETGQTSSVWNGVTLTKTSDESFGENAGMAFFLSCGDEIVSLLPAPFFDANVHYEAELGGALSRLTAKTASLHSSVTVTVPENEAGEKRVVEVLSSAARDMELVCYFEPILARQSDYEAHPAFSKLSLESALVDGAIVVRRRPRAKGRGIALALAVSAPFTFDTSREKALGRGGILAIKQALRRPAGGSQGAVLDPCVLVRVKLTLQPNVPCRVAFALTTAATDMAAASAANRILTAESPAVYSRLDETARRLSLTSEQLENAMALLPALVYPPADRRLDGQAYDALQSGQKALWAYGISGDLPIVTASVASDCDLPAAEELITAHRFLSENAAAFDLVFLLRDAGDYRSRLREGILDILRAKGLDFKVSARGGIHLADSAAPSASTVLAVSSRVIAPGEKLKKSEARQSVRPLPLRLTDASDRPALGWSYNDDNSVTFSGRLPENAWSQMLSNEHFGFLATDAGTGHLWHENARENKINKWQNDSLRTLGTEKLALLTATGPVSLFASPDGPDCAVTYGFGWAAWKKEIDGVLYTTTAFVPPDVSARIFIVSADREIDMNIAYETDLVLAPDEKNAVYVVTTHDDDGFTARNPYNNDFPDTVFRVTANVKADAFTCLKISALAGVYDGVTGAGFLPCIAARYKAVQTLVLVTGCDQDETLHALTDPAAASTSLDKTRAWWASITGKMSVKTPSDALNRYLNGWATYQTLACRVFGRSSLYQSGGAFGFRDQLQDVGALIDEVPARVRAHLLRAAAHQYEAGDVQHWWHPVKNKGVTGDKGVRTRCSDDLLWLPYTLCLYIEKTGDRDILSVPIPYLRSSPLAEDEQERYEEPMLSPVQEPLYTHAVRAVDLVLARGTGQHGLLLIGSGDWNDGMNLVGALGSGESVWLSWFACVTAENMAALCRDNNDSGTAARFAEAADALRAASNASWDGDWFLRGYYDDGAPLGSCTSEECRIDSIAQSFAAFAGGEPDKVKTALSSAVRKLYDKPDSVVRLFDPPFADGGSTPGYIKGYSPGFRENGGQYTHGAVWLAMGLFQSGMIDAGWDVLEALLPQERPVDVYRTEPYVLAADVYSAPGHIGRGGWTWYTGAAGWFKRVALENLLGLNLVGGVLHVAPRLPSSWDGYEADWQTDAGTYHITVKNGGETTVTLNGNAVCDGRVVVEKASEKCLSEKE